MSEISAAIGFNLIVISPTIALVGTALVLLFFTITIESNEIVKKSITFIGMLITSFCVFLKFGLFLENGVSSYFTQKILLDEFSLFGNVLISLILLFNFLPIWDSSKQLKEKTTEAIILTLMSASGFMLMVDSENLIMLFIGLEIGSISLYALAGLNRGDKLSNEASLKYFLLGSLASCILIYGVSLVYVSFSVFSVYNLALGIAYVGPDSVPLTTSIGVLLIFIGLLFKIAAAPFQSWAPDVYQGSPTSVTVLFAILPKIAALTVFIKFLYGPFINLFEEWQAIIIFLSIASMILGAVAAIGQKNLKRLIAYSSISHMGYALAGLTTGTNQGIQSSIIYLIIYLIMNLAFFSCLFMLKRKDKFYENIEDLSGLSKKHPILALSFLIILFSLAGIPPLAGFFAKFYIFMAVIQKEMYFLAIVGLLATVIAAFYYLRVIKIIYFDPEQEKFDTSMSLGLKLTLILSTSAILMYFLNPNFLNKYITNILVI